MKILQVIPNLLSGGAESFTIELSLELTNKGHDCDVATLYDNLENTSRILRLQEKSKIISLHKKNGLDLSIYLQLYKLIKNGHYDVVHAHVNAIPYLLLSCILLPKVHYIATIHSDAYLEAGTKFMKWSRIILFKTRMCIPVTISQESLVSFKKLYRMSAPLINNGISEYIGHPTNNLRDNTEQLLFIHPASCQEVKNQKLLFQAFSRLANDNPNIKLIWLGNNTSYSALYNELQQYMIPQIQYYGVVSNVRDYLYQADALCLSSKMEGMPMTIIEAFSVGCPSLCTPVGGIKNMIVKGKNGMLSENLTVDSYYEMLKTFINLTPDQRKQMRIEASSSFMKYSISSCADKYLLLYNQ